MTRKLNIDNDLQDWKIEHQAVTKCINHWAESTGFKGVTPNQHCGYLTGKCFEMPNASYTIRPSTIHPSSKILNFNPL